MPPIKSRITALLAALLLAACGGGSPDVPGSAAPAGAPTTAGHFTALVSFGDSLSDVGTYQPATATGIAQFPYLGGKFTTNSATGTIWVENLATTLGLTVTPAEVGWGGQSVKCPAAAVNAALAGTCTAYGQGGSRVTDPNGIGHASGAGALTVPVVTQIANHLQRFGSFKDTDLILVYAGNNDVFTQFGAFAASAATIQAQAAAGAITQDQAQQQLFDARDTAFAGMKLAAQQLAADVRDQILAKGGKYVAVMTLTDIADTPFGNSPQVAAARDVLTQLSQIFNLWLRDGLAGQPVQIIDTYALFKDLAPKAVAQGMNITTPACDVTKIATLTGQSVQTLQQGAWSLFCNSTPGPFNGLVTGADATTWLFADSVHPTTGGHKLMSDAFAAQLHAFGWI